MKSGEEESIRNGHLDYFLGLAERAETKLLRKEQIVWLERLEMKHDNLRAALEWSQTKGDIRRVYA
jgi:predicted ATPase